MYDADLFGEPVGPSQRVIPRRDSQGYLAYLAALSLPHGWKFHSLAPTMTRMPHQIESVWVTDHEREFRHLFIDRVTAQEWHFDPSDGWSS
jgi:hypothetical protein